MRCEFLVLLEPSFIGQIFPAFDFSCVSCIITGRKFKKNERESFKKSNASEINFTIDGGGKGSVEK